MKIVLIGMGKIGRAVVNHLSREGHEIVVIDMDPQVIEQSVNSFDVMGLVGNGGVYEIQQQAGVDKADVVLSITDSDEANILNCLIAKNLGATHTVARVRDYDYSKQINMIKNELGVSTTINPEKEAAKEIMRIINFPTALRVDTFATDVDLVELSVPDNSQLAEQPLYLINKMVPAKFLICAVQRGNEVIIPTGSFIIKPKDKIHITSKRADARIFMNKLGFVDSKIKRIMIIGGGETTVYLCEELIKNNMDVKVIEKDKDRCEVLAELFKKVTIVNADGSDQRILEEEGIDQTDAIICLTGFDEENIIISMYANKKHVSKIICKINKSSFADILESVELASVISPKDITASQIVSYIRATSNSRGNEIKTLYKLINNEIEAIEFAASSTSKVIDICLKDLKLKPKILIASIIRNGELIIPTGATMIKDGDSVIVISSSGVLNDLDDIIE